MTRRLLVVVLLAAAIFGIISTRVNASPSLSVTHSGTFTQSHQADFYPITVGAGETHTFFETMPGCTDQTQYLADPALFLYDSNGNMIASNDDRPNVGDYCSFITYTFATAGTYTIAPSTWNCADSAPVNTASGLATCTDNQSNPGDYASAIGSYTLVIDGGAAARNAFISFDDGRLNKTADQTNQTAAIYCKAGTIEIYGVYKGVGYFAFRVTAEELAKFKPGVTNQLIKEKNGIRLYLLTSGELQVNAPPLEAGKPDYTFIFQPCKA